MTLESQTIAINTPAPYVSLKKDEKLSTVMTISASDPTGSSGIEADIKTITAHRCYAMSCISALTISSIKSVQEIQPTSKEFVESALKTNLKELDCDVIKTGFLSTDTVMSLAKLINEMNASQKPKLVMDLSFIGNSNYAASSDEFITTLLDNLTLSASLIIVNLSDCLNLVKDTRNIEKIEDILELAKDVQAVSKCANIFIQDNSKLWNKTNTWSSQTDVLLIGDQDKFIIYEGQKLPTYNAPGSSCTLSSAIASNLARGYKLEQAVYGGIEYLQTAITIGCDINQAIKYVDGTINHVYAIEVPLEKMIKDECFTGNSIISERENIYVAPSILKDLPIIRNDFTSYLENHPLVKPHWLSYINHEFVKQIALGTLPPYKYKFFIEQDYLFLTDFGRVHCIAASKAPTTKDMENELYVVSVCEREANHHRTRLTKYFGVNDEAYYAKINRGPALQNYARYFIDIAEKGTWSQIILSLTPCGRGYGGALLQVKDIICTDSQMYKDWLEVYSSPMCIEGMENYRRVLNEIGAKCPPEQLEYLVKIYADVCELETKFWDAALEYEE